MKRLFLLSVMSVMLFACSKEDRPVSPKDIHNAESVYPAPKGRWFGGSHPSYLADGWVGDVMPYYQNDTFHIFYLHDARNGTQGFHPWAELTTTDLKTYHNKGIMIPYGSTGDHDLALGTGSVVKVRDTYYAYYSGVNGNLPIKDVILLATSKDLQHWDKQKGFIIKPETQNGYDKFSFRDPFVFYNKEKKKYWMLVCGKKNDEAAVMLYTSDDPVSGNWNLQSPLYTDAAYDVPECPQELRWGDYWYLIFSDNSSENSTHYRIASSSDGPWIKPENDLFDGQYMYASRVAANEENTYLFGWVPTKSGFTDEGNREWGGNLVVHELTQNEDGTLEVKIPNSVAEKFTNGIPLHTAMKQVNVIQNGQDFKFDGNGYVLFNRIVGENMVTAEVSDLTDSSSFGFLFGKAQKGLESNYYKILFDATNKTISAVNIHDNIPEVEAQIDYKMPTDRENKLQVVIDGSVCVVYVNGEVALTSRIYSLQHHYWGIITEKNKATFKHVEIRKPKKLL